VAETAPYGSWRSPITSDVIVARVVGLSSVSAEGDDIYWLESRPGEGGRNVVVRRSVDGGIADLTPAPYNARTRVHEYGGGAAVISRGVVYFSHFVDQRLYRQGRGEAPSALTPAVEAPGGEPRWRYADGVIDERRGRWIGVREEHGPDGVVNALVTIDLAAPDAGQVLAQGHDFYASPKLSPDGGRLAWLSWDHPNMPWVGTELWEAGFAADGTLADPRRIAGGPAESIFQPEWSPDGVLHFVSDRTGWWNLYRCEAGGIRPLCPRAAEFGQAQWVFGQSTYGFLDAQRIACAFREAGRASLAVLDLRSGTLNPIPLSYSDFASVRTQGGRVLCVAGSPLGPPAVLRIDPASGTTEVLRQTGVAAENPELHRYFSAPRHLSVATGDGETAYAHYYPPHNPDYLAPSGEMPPLLVKCHGGPTAAAGTSLNPGTQFWTSRGVAVLDVDYRGSTGYGRAYRDRLAGAWGVVDVEDCVNAARHAAAEGLADPERAVISGGSAGGYTVLAALARHDFFKGGASYYGVSDIAALARDTHKFESRYLDWLIGPYPARAELYRERSPLTHADGIACPVIFFQGGEDRIVPPNQTEMMVDALRRRNIPVGYLLFAGEQHGFRRAENVKRALDAELYFYAALVFRTRLGF
jgi:dipeptidyl aminopeptidase/acylaminoacyl peptidase